MFISAPEYKSKLFLDCCGLVRRVMRDLAEDFGFIIGPWNQAYMYDTLPITVPSEREMKPGDLVFVSAIYYNPKCMKISAYISNSHRFGIEVFRVMKECQVECLAS